jgi:hypothetical protein
MQQGPPSVPQPEHLPAVHMPRLLWPLAHIAPGATHEFPKQHAPPAHVEPAQQTVPGSPQRAHT